MQTEYVRSLNCNYERVFLEAKPQEKKYQYCILGRGGIKGLLSCSLRYINGQAYLYYDISSKQNIAQLYGNRCISREWVKDFLWSFWQIRQELERFLLDAGNVLWYPQQIFQDLESNVFSFLYIPYYKGESSFGHLLEFLAEHIDYGDEVLADCVYHMYEQLERSGDVYLDARIFEDAKCLELPIKLQEKEQTEETTDQGEELPGELVSENRCVKGEGGREKKDNRRIKVLGGKNNKEEGEERREANRESAENEGESRKADRYKEAAGAEKRETGEEMRLISRERGENGRNKRLDSINREEECRNPEDIGSEKREDRKKIFGFWESRRKRNKENREDYIESMQEAMGGYEGFAVAEETKYEKGTEEEEFGQTIFMEEKPEQEKYIRRLYTSEGKVLLVIDKALVTIGKKKEEADVVLEDSSVSRLHARIIQENGHYYIEDLNATNGTFKNGLRLQPYEKRELEEGDEIKFGRKMLVFR